MLRLAEQFWVGEYDDIDLSGEEVFDLIEEGLWALGFMIVEKNQDVGKFVARLKSSIVDSLGTVTFAKDQKHVTISVGYGIILPDVEYFSLDEKTVESEKTRLEGCWKNLVRLFDSLFLSGFVPVPDIRDNCCSNCGRVIDLDSNFCKYCGHKI